PLFAKIDVNGSDAAPLYQNLKKAKPGLLGSEAIKWNFTKFLVDRKGKVVERYAPNVEPQAIAGDIEKLLQMSTLDRFRIACAVLTLWLAVTVFAHAADPNKVLHVAFPIAETGFDPQAGGDAYSNYVNRVIFDSLYIYDYLARPHKIVPNTAMALPEISADGKTWMIKVRPGIYFSDDPALKGAMRELSADEYVFAWKRVLDPKMRSISN